MFELKKCFTYPCCVLSQVATSVLHSVGVMQFLEKLNFLDDILPFLHKRERRSFKTKKNLAYAIATDGKCGEPFFFITRYI